MKTKILQLAIFIVLISTVKAQDTGKMIIRNASNTYPKFIASLNGIRLVNDYSDVTTFSFLDDTRYRLKLFQAGSGNLLTFTITSEPKYVSKYMITKDNVGNYSVVLESKSLLTMEEEPVITTSTPHTVTVLPPVVTYTAPTTTTSNVIPQASVTITNISSAEFNERLAAVKKTSFEDKKLAKAKQVYDDEILSTNQVIDVLKVFSFDDSKLDFAKWAYSRTIDQKNYYKVDDSFSFSNTKTALADFIKKQPK